MASFADNSSIVTKEESTQLYTEPLPLKYCYTGLLLTVFFFQTVNRVVTSWGPPKALTASKSDLFKWQNLLVSWVHAVILGCWDLAVIFGDPVMQKDLIKDYSYFSYAMLTFSTGYFIYDLMDIVLNGKTKSQWEVVLHHVAVGAIFSYNLVTFQCVAYNAIALLAEVNSMFLHSRKLLQMCNVPFDATFYRVICYINLVTFILCRFGGQLLITIGMFMWYDRVTMVYYVTLTMSMAVMFAINVVLFYRLWKNDIVRYNRTKKSLTNNNNKAKVN